MRSFTPIAGRRVRFALVGCGRISSNHFDARSLGIVPTSANARVDPILDLPIGTIDVNPPNTPPQ
jgi:hypothetical protein